MADVQGKVKRIIEEYVDQEEYFTIDRARRYGKTTILYLVQEKLKERCVVLSISFEGKEEYFVFENHIGQALAMEEIGERITELCERAERPVILMIDEVDKAADNQVFLTFLGMLRERYLKRRVGGDATFDSVILAGVHDIKNLKMKIRPGEETNYNSPWNISAVFDVDMGLSVNEIASMLREYENDVHTGMDVLQISLGLHDYTDGYPFLVSYLCKIIDEKGLPWDKIGRWLLKFAIR